jgi:hypothetical protein
MGYLKKEKKKRREETIMGCYLIPGCNSKTITQLNPSHGVGLTTTHVSDSCIGIV